MTHYGLGRHIYTLSPRQIILYLRVRGTDLYPYLGFSNIYSAVLLDIDRVLHLRALRHQIDVSNSLLPNHVCLQHEMAILGRTRFHHPLGYQPRHRSISLLHPTPIFLGSTCQGTVLLFPAYYVVRQWYRAHSH